MHIQELLKEIETEYNAQEKEITRLNKCLKTEWDNVDHERQVTKKLRNNLYNIRRDLKRLLTIVDIERKNKDMTIDHKKHLLNNFQTITDEILQKTMKALNEE